MMTTFHIIHILVGLWLALVNVTNILTPTTLAWNNLVLGLIVAAITFIIFCSKTCRGPVLKLASSPISKEASILNEGAFFLFIALLCTRPGPAATKNAVFEEESPPG